MLLHSILDQSDTDCFTCYKSWRSSMKLSRNEPMRLLRPLPSPSPRRPTLLQLQPPRLPQPNLPPSRPTKSLGRFLSPIRSSIPSSTVKHLQFLWSSTSQSLSSLKTPPPCPGRSAPMPELTWDLLAAASTRPWLPPDSTTDSGSAGAGPTTSTATGFRPPLPPPTTTTPILAPFLSSQNLSRFFLINSCS